MGDYSLLKGNYRFASLSRRAADRTAKRLPMAPGDNGIKFHVLTPEDNAEVVAGAEAEDEAATADEEYWRLFREEVECIRQLRALLPNTAQLAMSADEITEY